jgi:molecular chaperone DnaJ
VGVPTLDGEVEVDVPAGTQPGTVVTLRGKGMPAIGRRGRGDQQVVLNVVIPRNLTERQRELLGELRESITEANLREVEDESILAKVRRALR